MEALSEEQTVLRLSKTPEEYILNISKAVDKMKGKIEVEPPIHSSCKISSEMEIKI
jgi:hypothetical protein